MDEIIGLFPTPFMLVDRLLSDELLASCRNEAMAAKRDVNAQTSLLSHTEPVNPAEKPGYREIVDLIAPKLADFGVLLFGERLEWTIKEMWVNVLETGGHQIIHTHANSFISGVIYVTPSHPSARTVFHKSIGGNNFIFRHASRTSQMGPFNADKWIMPEVGPGAMVLFPSYLLHEVPVNKGGQRITVAFNAIPNSLESWGYRVHFA